jgi:hypothetical protein
MSWRGLGPAVTITVIAEALHHGAARSGTASIGNRSGTQITVLPCAWQRDVASRQQAVISSRPYRPAGGCPRR